MLISDAFTASYSHVEHYVRKMLPIMPRYVPNRYKIYKKYCSDDKLAEAGITWGKGPELVIYNITALRGYTTAGGLFSEQTSTNTIYFDIDCADKYQAKPERYEVAIQYLLLHELIHWARYQAKADPKVSGKEAGNLFELEAYGQDVSYLWGRR